MFIRRLISLIKREGIKGIWRHVLIRLYLAKFWFLKIINKDTIKAAYGLRLKSNYNDATFKFYVTGTYGYFYYNRILNIKHPFVFLDIGANQGLYAITAAKNKFNVASYAFEPVPETYFYLEQNIILNNAQEKCIPINKAISDKNGKVEIAVKQNHSGGATLSSNNDAFNAVTAKKIIIETIDSAELTRLVTQKDVSIVVKIDVEGLEPLVIDQIISSGFIDNVDEIFFEVNEDWINVDSIKDKFRNSGFSGFKKIGLDKMYDLLVTRS